MNRQMWLIVLTVAAVGVAAVLLYALPKMRPDQRPAPPPPAAAPSPDSGPQIRYPIEAGKKPLPPLNQSDVAVRVAILDVLGDRSLEALVNPQQLVRRVVATIDNLPRRKLAPHLMPMKPVSGNLLTMGVDGSTAIAPENSARYFRYVGIVETLDAKRLVAVYAQFYPLFQQAYQELGYPNGYFNDRLIEVIDNLLETPDARKPIRVVRPKVFFEFEEPELEALPAGQKILIRVGAVNASRIKAKLREIRAELLMTGQNAETAQTTGLR